MHIVFIIYKGIFETFKGGGSTSYGYIIKPFYRETLSTPYLAKASTIVFPNLSWRRKTTLILVDKAHISLKINQIFQGLAFQLETQATTCSPQ